MKVSEIKGDQALDVLADIMDSAVEIMLDKEIAEQLKIGNQYKAVTLAIRNHKSAVKYMLARLEGEDPETYEPSLISLPMKVLEVVNDPYIAQLFTSQGQIKETSSGSAMVNTEE